MNNRSVVTGGVLVLALVHLTGCPPEKFGSDAFMGEFTSRQITGPTVLEGWARFDASTVNVADELTMQFLVDTPAADGTVTVIPGDSSQEPITLDTPLSGGVSFPVPVTCVAGAECVVTARIEVSAGVRADVVLRASAFIAGQSDYPEDAIDAEFPADARIAVAFDEPTE